MFKPMKFSSICSLTLFSYFILMLPLLIYLTLSNKIILLEWEILSNSSYAITFPFIFDPISVSFSCVVCLISACVMFFTSSYMSADPFLTRFVWLVMLFVLSMNILVFVPSIISLLLGWDGLGIVSFALVIYYQNMKSLAAGMVTALANRIGDVLLLVSIAICANEANWNIMLIWEDSMFPWLCLCIMVGAMTKSAQIPFSAWLPAAMAAPTPVSALVHSSTLVTAGIFILVRFYYLLASWPLFNYLALFIGTITLLMAGIGANHEHDLKKIIALSTLSQLGVMMLSLGLGAWNLTLFHLYTHALFKALLFLCAGAIIHNNSNVQDIRSFGALATQMPLTITCLNIANLALCGAPFLSGFYSKDLILETCLYNPSNIVAVTLIFLATGMTAAYSIRLSLVTLWQESSNVPFTQNTDEDWITTTPIIILTFAAIAGGLTLQILFLYFNESIYLPITHKLLTITVTLLGGWIALMIWKLKISATPQSSIVMSFFSTMWFLSMITTQPNMIKPFLWAKTMTKSIDQGWLEILGGKGTLTLTTNSSTLIQIIQSKYINAMISIMFFTVASIILLTY
uniref:NADH dehydrogenase subunit 5 n=1 Tax=Clithon lentiginosum TaxID=1891254 RepID=UPI001FF62A13|nr:NADH dehydrogenase subunit 5 [Clithon lentiginosum]UOH96855.1 NADH dehydrogenase subunit 5 [Clithon lentiginosum]URF21496.1 NADH dehydrogenase subunit 5 [Clithon lentiginosum]